MRRATYSGYPKPGRDLDFYPRSPCGERLLPLFFLAPPIPISIHALLAESDRGYHHTRPIYWNFYPRSPCGERPNFHDLNLDWIIISIHALLAESDRPSRPPANRQTNFYPRSPCGERPSQCRTLASGIYDFYPRSPCGERPYQKGAGQANQSISIHALLAESDTMQIVIIVVDTLFLSTLSLRRATGGHQKQHGIFRISIHALLAESDLAVADLGKRDIGISIHALLAESDPHIRSTSPGRRGISIHALLAESDCWSNRPVTMHT